MSKLFRNFYFIIFLLHIFAVQLSAAGTCTLFEEDGVAIDVDAAKTNMREGYFEQESFTAEEFAENPSIAASEEASTELNFQEFSVAERQNFPATFEQIESYVAEVGGTEATEGFAKAISSLFGSTKIASLKAFAMEIGEMVESAVNGIGLIVFTIQWTDGVLNAFQEDRSTVVDKIEAIVSPIIPLPARMIVDLIEGTVARAHAFERALERMHRIAANKDHTYDPQSSSYGEKRMDAKRTEIKEHSKSYRDIFIPNYIKSLVEESIIMAQASYSSFVQQQEKLLSQAISVIDLSYMRLIFDATIPEEYSDLLPEHRGENLLLAYLPTQTFESDKCLGFIEGQPYYEESINCLADSYNLVFDSVLDVVTDDSTRLREVAISSFNAKKTLVQSTVSSMEQAKLDMLSEEENNKSIYTTIGNHFFLNRENLDEPALFSKSDFSDYSNYEKSYFGLDIHKDIIEDIKHEYLINAIAVYNNTFAGTETEVSIFDVQYRCPDMILDFRTKLVGNPNAQKLTGLLSEDAGLNIYELTTFAAEYNVSNLLVDNDVKDCKTSTLQMFKTHTQDHTSLLVPDYNEIVNDWSDPQSVYAKVGEVVNNHVGSVLHGIALENNPENASDIYGSKSILLAELDTIVEMGKKLMIKKLTHEYIYWTSRDALQSVVEKFAPACLWPKYYIEQFGVTVKSEKYFGGTGSDSAYGDFFHTAWNANPAAWHSFFSGGATSTRGTDLLKSSLEGCNEDYGDDSQWKYMGDDANVDGVIERFRAFNKVLSNNNVAKLQFDTHILLEKPIYSGLSWSEFRTLEQEAPALYAFLDENTSVDHGSATFPPYEIYKVYGAYGDGDDWTDEEKAFGTSIYSGPAYQGVVERYVADKYTLTSEDVLNFIKKTYQDNKHQVSHPSLNSQDLNLSLASDVKKHYASYDASKDTGAQDFESEASKKLGKFVVLGMLYDLLESMETTKLNEDMDTLFFQDSLSPDKLAWLALEEANITQAFDFLESIKPQIQGGEHSVIVQDFNVSSSSVCAIDIDAKQDAFFEVYNDNVLLNPILKYVPFLYDTFQDLAYTGMLQLLSIQKFQDVACNADGELKVYGEDLNTSLSGTSSTFDDNVDANATLYDSKVGSIYFRNALAREDSASDRFRLIAVNVDGQYGEMPANHLSNKWWQYLHKDHLLDKMQKQRFSDFSYATNYPYPRLEGDVLVMTPDDTKDLAVATFLTRNLKPPFKFSFDYSVCTDNHIAGEGIGIGFGVDPSLYRDAHLPGGDNMGMMTTSNGSFVIKLDMYNDHSMRFRSGSSGVDTNYMHAEFKSDCSWDRVTIEVSDQDDQKIKVTVGAYVMEKDLSITQYLEISRHPIALSASTGGTSTMKASLTNFFVEEYGTKFNYDTGVLFSQHFSNTVTPAISNNRISFGNFTHYDISHASAVVSEFVMPTPPFNISYNYVACRVVLRSDRRVGDGFAFTFGDTGEEYTNALMNTLGGYQLGAALHSTDAISVQYQLTPDAEDEEKQKLEIVGNDQWGNRTVVATEESNISRYWLTSLESIMAEQCYPHSARIALSEDRVLQLVQDGSTAGGVVRTVEYTISQEQYDNLIGKPLIISAANSPLHGMRLSIYDIVVDSQDALSVNQREGENIIYLHSESSPTTLIVGNDYYADIEAVRLRYQHAIGSEVYDMSDDVALMQDGNNLYAEFANFNDTNETLRLFLTFLETTAEGADHYAVRFDATAATVFQDSFYRVNVDAYDGAVWDSSLSLFLFLPPNLSSQEGMNLHNDYANIAEFSFSHSELFEGNYIAPALHKANKDIATVIEHFHNKNAGIVLLWEYDSNDSEGAYFDFKVVDAAFVVSRDYTVDMKYRLQGATEFIDGGEIVIRPNQDRPAYEDATNAFVEISDGNLSSQYRLVYTTDARSTSMHTDGFHFVKEGYNATTTIDNFDDTGFQVTLDFDYVGDVYGSDMRRYEIAVKAQSLSSLLDNIYYFVLQRQDSVLSDTTSTEVWSDVQSFTIKPGDSLRADEIFTVKVRSDIESLHETSNVLSEVFEEYKFIDINLTNGAHNSIIRLPLGDEIPRSGRIDIYNDFNAFGTRVYYSNNSSEYVQLPIGKVSFIRQGAQWIPDTITKLALLTPEADTLLSYFSAHDNVNIHFMTKQNEAFTIALPPYDQATAKQVTIWNEADVTVRLDTKSADANSSIITPPKRPKVELKSIASLSRWVGNFLSGAAYQGKETEDQRSLISHFDEFYIDIDNASWVSALTFVSSLKVGFEDNVTDIKKDLFSGSLDRISFPNDSSSGRNGGAFDGNMNEPKDGLSGSRDGGFSYSSGSSNGNRVLPSAKVYLSRTSRANVDLYIDGTILNLPKNKTIVLEYTADGWKGDKAFIRNNDTIRSLENGMSELGEYLDKFHDVDIVLKDGAWTRDIVLPETASEGQTFTLTRYSSYYVNLTIGDDIIVTPKGHSSSFVFKDGAWRGDVVYITRSAIIRSFENNADVMADYLDRYNRVEMFVRDARWTRNLVLPESAKEGQQFKFTRYAGLYTNIYVNDAIVVTPRGKSTEFTFKRGAWRGGTISIGDNATLGSLENNADKIADYFEYFDHIEVVVRDKHWTRNLVLPPNAKEGQTFKLTRHSRYYTNLYVSGEAIVLPMGDSITMTFSNGAWRGDKTFLSYNSQISALEGNADKLAEYFEYFKHITITVRNGHWTRNIALPNAVRADSKITLVVNSSWAVSLHIDDKTFKIVQREKVELTFKENEWVEAHVLPDNPEHNESLFISSSKFPSYISSSTQDPFRIDPDIGVVIQYGIEDLERWSIDYNAMYLRIISLNQDKCLEPQTYEGKEYTFPVDCDDTSPIQIYQYSVDNLNIINASTQECFHIEDGALTYRDCDDTDQEFYYERVNKRLRSGDVCAAYGTYIEFVPCDGSQDMIFEFQLINGLRVLHPST